MIYPLMMHLFPVLYTKDSLIDVSEGSEGRRLLSRECDDVCTVCGDLVSARLCNALRSGSVIREHMTVLSTSNHYFKLLLTTFKRAESNI